MEAPHEQLAKGKHCEPLPVSGQEVIRLASYLTMATESSDANATSAVMLVALFFLFGFFKHLSHQEKVLASTIDGSSFHQVFSPPQNQ